MAKGEDYILPKGKQITSYFVTIIGVIVTVALAYLSYDLADKVSKDQTNIQKLNDLITKQDATIDKLNQIALGTNENIRKQDLTIDQLRRIVTGTNSYIRKLDKLIRKQDLTNGKLEKIVVSTQSNVQQLDSLTSNNKDQLDKLTNLYFIEKQKQSRRNRIDKQNLANIVQAVDDTIALYRTTDYRGQESFDDPKFQLRFFQMVTNLHDMASSPFLNGNEFLIANPKLDSAWKNMTSVLRSINTDRRLYGLSKEICLGWHKMLINFSDNLLLPVRYMIDQAPNE